MAIMPRRVVCLDTSVWIKYLTPEEGTDKANTLVETLLSEGAHIIAPSWMWAEVGSVLLKKVRRGILDADEADEIWKAFQQMNIEYVDTQDIRQHTWELARTLSLPTLYDAAFLACVEFVKTWFGLQT